MGDCEQRIGDFVEIVSYDPNWPAMFAVERQRLESVLSPSLNARIFHFGSTAVPGLAAKPIIDIVVLVEDRSLWPSTVDPLRSIDYVFWAENPNPDQMFFVKGMPPYGKRRTHHVHFYTPAEAKRRLMFCEILRADKKLAAAYAALKQRLSAQFRYDREAYTDAKKAFVDNALSSVSIEHNLDNFKRNIEAK